MPTENQPWYLEQEYDEDALDPFDESSAPDAPPPPGVTDVTLAELEAEAAELFDDPPSEVAPERGGEPQVQVEGDPPHQHAASLQEPPADPDTGEVTGACIACSKQTKNVEFVCEDCRPGAIARDALRQLSDAELAGERGGGRPAKQAKGRTAAEPRHDAVSKPPSNREIARKTGASEATVRRQRAQEMEERGLAQPDEDPAPEPAFEPPPALEQAGPAETVALQAELANALAALEAERHLTKDLEAGRFAGADNNLREQLTSARDTSSHWIREWKALSIKNHELEVKLDRARQAAADGNMALVVEALA